MSGSFGDEAMFTAGTTIYRGRPRTRATATVELAVVLPLVCILLFATVEFGLLLKDAFVLQQAAREACRAAMVGATPEQASARFYGKIPTLDPAKVTLSYSYRTFEGVEWSPWTELGVDEQGTQNDAPPGAQVRVVARYCHSVIMGGLGGIVGSGTTNEVPGIAISAVAVARRE